MTRTIPGPPAAPAPPNDQQTIQPAQLKKGIGFGQHGIELKTFDDLYRFSEMIAKTNFCPKDMRGKSADIMAAIQLGAEVGLGAVQAMQNIAVINGRPSIWGDSMLGLCQASPRFAHAIFAEWYKGSPYDDDFTAHCRVGRVGVAEPIIASFSVGDAKKAKLWDKQGPWQAYPKRMLQMRARGFALRNGFADILKGLWSREEMIDVEPIVDEAPSTTASEIEASLTADTKVIKSMTEAVAPTQEPIKPEAPAEKKARGRPKKTDTDLALLRTALRNNWAALSEDKKTWLLRNCDIADIDAIDTMPEHDLRTVLDATRAA